MNCIHYVQGIKERERLWIVKEVLEPVRFRFVKPTQNYAPRLATLVPLEYIYCRACVCINSLPLEQYFRTYAAQISENVVRIAYAGVDTCIGITNSSPQDEMCLRNSIPMFGQYSLMSFLFVIYRCVNIHDCCERETQQPVLPGSSLKGILSSINIQRLQLSDNACESNVLIHQYAVGKYLG